MWVIPLDRPPPIPNTIKFNIDSSLPRREQPALPTGTQGEEGYTHGIGVPPPLVGASGELKSHQQFCESHSTTITSGRKLVIKILIISCSRCSLMWRSEGVNFAKCDRIFSVKSEMANINESRSRGQYWWVAISQKGLEMTSNGMENSEWSSLHFYVGSNMA